MGQIITADLHSHPDSSCAQSPASLTHLSLPARPSMKMGRRSLPLHSFPSDPATDPGTAGSTELFSPLAYRTAMAWHCHLSAVMCCCICPEHQAPASHQVSPAVLDTNCRQAWPRRTASCSRPPVFQHLTPGALLAHLSFLPAASSPREMPKTRGFNPFLSKALLSLEPCRKPPQLKGLPISATASDHMLQSHSIICSENSLLLPHKLGNTQQPARSQGLIDMPSQEQ